VKHGNEMEQDFLSIKEFASELGVHHNTIRRCIARGRINAIRVGGIRKSIYRIPRSELQRLAIKDLEYIIDKIVEEKCRNLFPNSL
jgi:excisionase family DNA binding protein